MHSTLRRLSNAARFLNPVTLVRTLNRVDELAQATRELTRSVDLLRVRTEQLLTIEQMNWDTQGKVSRLTQQLTPERVRAHVTRAIAKAPLDDDPFPHLIVDEWLPDDVYDRLIDALPPSVFFADRDDSRQQLPVPLHFAPDYSRRVWQFLAQDVVTGMVGPALTDRLGPTIHDYLTSYCEVPDGIDLSLHASNGRIMLRRPGYVIPPHRDPRWGFITCLAYLARPGDNAAYGTQLYRVRDDEEAPSGKPFYLDQSRCELVKSVPFQPNTMLVFLNSTGAHGASIPAEAQPATLERYLYQFRLGPTSRTIAELLACMPEHKRVMWAGTKSARAGDAGYD
jgi:hypothetical protein